MANWSAFLALGAGLLAGPALAECPAWVAQGLAAPGASVDMSRVVEVVDGDTVVLEGGAQLRLTGIQAPKLPLGRPGFETWPLAEEAKRAAEDITGGKTLVLVVTGRAMDRHGRKLAQAVVQGAPPIWLQGEMVRRGFARVYSFRDNRACAAELYAREAEARAAKRGIWGLKYYALRDATADLGRDLGTFQIVEGTVTRALRTSHGAYLDFGADYKTDFSIFIATRDLRLFDEAGLDVASWRGKKLRVRGWLSKRNGPQIEVTHPEQIER